MRRAETAAHDWDNSHSLDLSDARLLADLKKRQGLSPDKLVLYEDGEDWTYHKHHHSSE